MIKNLTINQLILIAFATVLLLIAAFSFYLLQNPSAPLPFVPPPATITYTRLSAALADTAVPNTPTPTRRISYTPLAAFMTPGLGTLTETPTQLGTPGIGTPTETPTQLGTPGPGTVPPTSAPIYPPPSSPNATLPFTDTPPPGTVSPSPVASTSPTATSTFSAGEVGITGRVIQNGTPMPNVIVRFADDAAARQSTTYAGGHYSFITLAPGTNFTLTFRQSDNPGLTPATEIASLGSIEGTLPTGVNPIDIPDMEISIKLSGVLFELLSPVDGATYSASAINGSNPLEFTWSLYSQGGSYSVEVGPNGVSQPVWASNQLASTRIMWDGTLTDGTHIAAGNYWWRVAVTKSLGNYIVVIYTQQFDLLFNP